MSRNIEQRVEDIAEIMEDKGEPTAAVQHLRDKHGVPEFDDPVGSPVPDLPVFWDGTPGTLAVGMVCREGKESVAVQAIIPCINGTIILGLVGADGQVYNINITQPRKHPLSDVADEAERRKLWEYDQL